MQNNFWNKTSVIIGILGIIVAIIVGIWTNREKTISLNILKFKIYNKAYLLYILKRNKYKFFKFEFQKNVS